MPVTPHVVQGNSDAATILLDSTKVDLLEPFLRGPLSAAAASKRLGIPAKRMLYWINKFVEQGLLVQEGVDPASRAALYRAVSSSFTVKDLDVFIIEEHIDQQFDPVWREFKAGLKCVARRESVNWNFHVSLDERSTIIRRFLPSHSAESDLITPNVKELNTWLYLPLHREDIKRLHDEFDSLLQKYIQLAQKTRSQDTPMMLIHLGMIPSQVGER